MTKVFNLLARLAKRFGLYQSIRYSPLYDLVLRVRNPSYLKEQSEDEAFYRQVLGPSATGLIFDVGANVGDKTAIFSRIASRVVSFEPDPRLARDLRRRFARNPMITIEAKGVSDHVGVVQLHAYDDGSPYNTMNSKQHEQAAPMHTRQTLLEVPVTTLDEAIRNHGVPDFLKVDVEGHEKEVFKGLSQGIRMVSFEANLPVFRTETCEVARRIAQFNPGVRFAVGGSGLVFDFSFPLSCEEFCAFASRDDAPGYLEVFARSHGMPDSP